MAKPIPSTKANLADWFKVPPVFGLQRAPWRLSNERVWGKRHTIEFLIRLANDWGAADNMYGQIEQFGSFAAILLGDVGPEGGEKHPSDKVTDHKSHQTGVDLDIYVLRKDGRPDKTSILPIDVATFDRERTTQLAKSIYKAGRGDVFEVFFDDIDIIDVLLRTGITSMGPDSGRVPGELDPAKGGPTPHKDHFHVRLKP